MNVHQYRLSDEAINAMNVRNTYVPSHTRRGLQEYIEQRLPGGDFLRLVLSNDLAGSIGHADHINYQHIQTIIAWLFNYAPASIWGSPEKYRAHIEGRAL